MVQGGSSLVTPTEVIQCVDVILRQGTLESYVKVIKYTKMIPNFYACFLRINFRFVAFCVLEIK